METLEVGHARECITPPLGIGMRGYAARTDGAADVHDDLFVNAVVLENGNERVAILAYDLCGFGKEGGAEFKSAIEQATGLDPDKVLLNASHTHAGPGLGRAEADQMENDYRQQVRDKGVEALRAALENTAPATFAVGAAPV
ncbi:MAG: hypothetical protein KAX44_04615, partial [Candidatus Brocadiae bacterium]|nr:hypothetical protein [Candidatus Brocadiia bacterium]